MECKPGGPGLPKLKPFAEPGAELWSPLLANGPPLSVDQMWDLIAWTNQPLWGWKTLPPSAEWLRPAAELLADAKISSQAQIVFCMPHIGARMHFTPEELLTPVETDDGRRITTFKSFHASEARPIDVVFALQLLGDQYRAYRHELWKVSSKKNRDHAAYLATSGRQFLDATQMRETENIYKGAGEDSLHEALRILVGRYELSKQYLEGPMEGTGVKGPARTRFICGPLSYCYGGIYNKTAGRHWKKDANDRHWIAQGPFVRFATKFFEIVGLPVGANTVGNAFKGA